MQRPLLVLTALLALTAPAFADKADLEKKLEKKLAAGWIKDPKWITDYDEAKAQAKKTGKVIFGYFTRSYSY
jgi:hypothetical protein